MDQGSKGREARDQRTEGPGNGGTKGPEDQGAGTRQRQGVRGEDEEGFKREAAGFDLRRSQDSMSCH